MGEAQEAKHEDLLCAPDYGCIPRSELRITIVQLIRRLYVMHFTFHLDAWQPLSLVSQGKWQKLSCRGVNVRHLFL